MKHGRMINLRVDTTRLQCLQKCRDCNAVRYRDESALVCSVDCAANVRREACTNPLEFERYKQYAQALLCDQWAVLGGPQCQKCQKNPLFVPARRRSSNQRSCRSSPSLKGRARDPRRAVPSQRGRSPELCGLADSAKRVRSSTRRPLGRTGSRALRRVTGQGPGA